MFSSDLFTPEMLPNLSKTSNAKSWYLKKIAKQNFAILFSRCGRANEQTNGRSVIDILSMWYYLSQENFKSEFLKRDLSKGTVQRWTAGRMSINASHERKVLYSTRLKKVEACLGTSRFIFTKQSIN